MLIIKKLKFKSDILKFSSKSNLYKFKNLSATYYQENKKDYKKQLVKDFKIF